MGIKLPDEENSKDSGIKFSLSKFDYELFHEEDNKIEPLIRVKRVNLPGNGENWKIYQNNKLIMTIEGIKFNKAERAFLGTLEGFNLLIHQFKKNNTTVTAIKKEIKSKLK
jgi:hypothetical protein